MGAENFIRERLRSFYSKNEINSVPDISAREFGIGEFGQKISSRHLAFKSSAELNTFLCEKAPFYISYSCAHYQFPAARPMEKKIMQGADLIYEFDADDIKTECKLNHDSWACFSCGAKGKGGFKECPECGGGTKVDEWVCKECLGETKNQTLRMLKLIEEDFGLTNGISINFSGSKGFHTHIRAKEIQSLSKSARLELIDYLTLSNMDFESMGFDFSSKVLTCPKKSSAKGWAKKMLDMLSDAFEQGDETRLALMGSISVLSARKLLKEKRAIISGLERGVLLGAVGVKPQKFYTAIMQHFADAQRLLLDRQTSIDINKIIRVPNTLHGSTGLRAMEFSRDSFKEFDALKEAVAFGENEVSLAGVFAPKFYLGGKWFGPFNLESVLLPEFAAVYLAAKGKAEYAGK